MADADRGSKVTWRFVALHGTGARVLITPKDSSDPRADELRVVVTGFRSRAETLLEFLSRDAIRSMNAVADPVNVARELLRSKFDDPVGAVVAAAYFLLRVNAADQVPLAWFENLSRNFRLLPDTATVRCAWLLRGGSRTHSNEFNPLKLLRESLSNRWPVFTEGVNLLQEAPSLPSNSLLKADPVAYHKVQALGAGKGWAGAITSFYGQYPDEPDVLRWGGMPRAPRRRQIIPQLVKYRRPKDTTLVSTELFQALPQLQIERVPTLPAFSPVEIQSSQLPAVQIPSSRTPAVQIPSAGEFSGLPAAMGKPGRVEREPDNGEFLLGSVGS